MRCILFLLAGSYLHENYNPGFPLDAENKYYEKSSFTFNYLCILPPVSQIKKYILDSFLV